MSRDLSENNQYILPLNQSSYSKIKLVGGKAASLGEMLQAGIVVPDGYVITTSTYRANNLHELKEDILKHFDRLGAQRVAVRSSAVAEDSGSASWAGQLDTVLNVSRSGLINAIEYCWRSMQSKRAQSYAKDHNIPKAEQAVAVVIQAMVNSDMSGVMFTANPTNSNGNESVVEAVYGLGEMLVQGTVTPESWVLNNGTGDVVSHSEHRQSKKLTYLNGKNQEVAIDKPGAILTNQQLRELLKQGKRIEKYYGKPQDIEFTFEANKLYIVQSRPITTHIDKEGSELPEFFSHCIKTIARPATLQRDEIVRFTSNAVAPVEVVTLPLEGTTRAYYLEASGSKNIMKICMDNVSSESQLAQHLNDYEKLKTIAEGVCELMERDPSNYATVLTKYRQFLTNLAPFLYTGVAVDAIIYPKFKEVVDKNYPEEATRILDIVATPKAHHDYQKLRLAICKLKLANLPSSETKEKIGDIVNAYAHVNEYSFVEPLLTVKKVTEELDQLTTKSATAEIEDIEKSIDASQTSADWLKGVLKPELYVQGLVVKEYALLRTDRIDQLKRTQTKLRDTLSSLAADMTKEDHNSWTKEHLANCLDSEIDAFISRGKIPEFEAIRLRIAQKYLYYYTNDSVTVVTDPSIVEKAKSIVITPENSKNDSLISPGTTAFPGSVSGRVVRIANIDDLSKVERGDIMVAHVTMPDYTPVMKIAGGFITAEGGVTSHAAIVARELGKPCIVGANNCMDILKDGDFISLDAGKQIVAYLQLTDHYDLGQPEDLFYWGPSRAQSLYMGDFTIAAEKFFQNAHKDLKLPNPPKTLVLFYGGKVVWLINAKEFGKFVEGLFEAYEKRNKLNEDIAAWHKVSKTLDHLTDKLFTDALLEAWKHTLFAEFSLYGAESSLAKRLKRFSASDRQEIWGAFTVPDNSTFLGRMDKELLSSKDPLAMAKKYPWIEDGYDGVSHSATKYFTRRLKMLQEEHEDKSETKKDRVELAKKFGLSQAEVRMLTLARELAEFMDDRKAWMMQTRRLIKEPIGDIEHGWFYDMGEAASVDEKNAKELWERYVDFKTSSSVVKGLVASNGGRHFINGEVVIVDSPTDIVSNDKVLAVPSTSPSYVPLMRKARALITDHGGMMSHAAIVAREFGLPCIVGTKQATKVLKNGDKVVLDLVKGEVNK